MWARLVPIETARGLSGQSGVCVHVPVALVSNSASAASSPLGLMEPGVRASSMEMWRTASATSVPVVVRKTVQSLINVCFLWSFKCYKYRIC